MIRYFAENGSFGKCKLVSETKHAPLNTKNFLFKIKFNKKLNLFHFELNGFKSPEYDSVLINEQSPNLVEAHRGISKPKVMLFNLETGYHSPEYGFISENIFYNLENDHVVLFNQESFEEKDTNLIFIKKGAFQDQNGLTRGFICKDNNEYVVFDDDFNQIENNGIYTKEDAEKDEALAELEKEKRASVANISKGSKKHKKLNPKFVLGVALLDCDRTVGTRMITEASLEDDGMDL